jgi:hypothetical protein
VPVTVGIRHFLHFYSGRQLFVPPKLENREFPKHGKDIQIWNIPP